jgi:hypothetical protein
MNEIKAVANVTRNGVVDDRSGKLHRVRVCRGPLGERFEGCSNDKAFDFVTVAKHFFIIIIFDDEKEKEKEEEKEEERKKKSLFSPHIKLTKTCCV